MRMYDLWMKKYKFFIDWIERIELWFSTFLLGALTLLVMTEVISRYLFKRPFPWVMELSMIMITYIVFIGIPVMYKQKALIILEFLFNRLPIKGQRYLALIWEVVIGIFMVYLIVATYELLSIQKRYTSPTLDISFQFFSLPVLFCGLSMLMFNLYFILEHLREIVHQGKKEMDEERESVK